MWLLVWVLGTGFAAEDEVTSEGVEQKEAGTEQPATAKNNGTSDATKREEGVSEEVTVTGEITEEITVYGDLRRR